MSKTAKIWLLIAGIALIYLTYLLSPILTPFLLGLLFAYLGNPLVNRLVKLKIPRILATTIVFTVILLLIILFLIWLIPLIERQIVILINTIPTIFSWVQQKIQPLLQKYFGIQSSLNSEGIRNILAEHWQQAGNIATMIIATITRSGYTFAMFLVNLAIIPVVAFYLMRDWYIVTDGIRKLLPRKIEPTVVKLAHECDDVIGAFFRGQLLVMLCLGVYYSLGLTFMGLQLGLLIGLIIGIFSIVPYLGFMIGITIASITTMIQFHDWLHIVYLLIIFAIGNTLENYILAPILVGDRIGLHPVAVIFAILAGGQLFGFLGILLALPTAAVIMVVVRYAYSKYLASDVYTKPIKQA